MKVYISKYRNHWLSPYTICEWLCFWREIDYEERWVVVVNKILDPVMTVALKVADFVHPRVEYVKIDYWDVWSMDSTLTPIILPMLKKLRDQKCGAPHVEDKDVPKHLRSTSAPPKENPWDTDALWFARWEWVIDEMIWAFEQTADDTWEDQFFKNLSGPKKDRKFDRTGYNRYSKRIDNGLMLFGKYYRALWS